MNQSLRSTREDQRKPTVYCGLILGLAIFNSSLKAQGFHEWKQFPIPSNQANSTFGGQIAASGKLAAIGMPEYDAGLQDSGGLSIYRLSDGGGRTWRMEIEIRRNGTLRLVPDINTGGQLGHGLAICDDYVLAGTPFFSSHVGGVYVFWQPPGGKWGQVDYWNSSTGSATDLFGFSVAAEGELAVVGAPGDCGTGKAHIFQKPSIPGGPWTLVGELSPPNGVMGDDFGCSVAIWGDYVLVGAPALNNSRPEKAYIFKRIVGGGWGLHAELTNPGSKGDGFGTSVGLSPMFTAQGRFAFVGAPHALTMGAVYCYMEKGLQWPPCMTLQAGNGLPGDGFGTSLSVSEKALLLVGAPGTDSDSGSGYVFRLTGGAWNQISNTLQPASPNQGDRFGQAVALGGTDAWIGRPQSGTASRVGEASLFIGLTGFSLLGPDRGLAGEQNRLVTPYATPNDDVLFVYGFSEGKAGVAGCASTVLWGVANPSPLGGLIRSTRDGVATYTGFVPSKASMRTVFIQALDLASCRLSNVVEYKFPK